MTMKEIPLISTCIAMGIMTAAPTAVFAIDPQQSDFTNATIGKDTMLLAQADTAGSKKASVDKKHDKGPKLNVDQKGVILKGYDPVAYFKQGKAVKGNPSITSVYKGATYYFASNSDKADFDKSPAKFAPQYGGFCADSMSKKKLKDTDPNVFFIYKGKLYVCSSPAAVKEFSSKPDVNIPKADANWQLYELPSSPGFNREFGS
jgi:YHS domain-containing protein